MGVLDDFLMVDLEWVDDGWMLKNVDLWGDIEGGRRDCDVFWWFGGEMDIVIQKYPTKIE